MEVQEERWLSAECLPPTCLQGFRRESWFYDGGFVAQELVQDQDAHFHLGWHETKQQRV